MTHYVIVEVSGLHITYFFKKSKLRDTNKDKGLLILYKASIFKVSNVLSVAACFNLHNYEASPDKHCFSKAGLLQFVCAFTPS